MLLRVRKAFALLTELTVPAIKAAAPSLSANNWIPPDPTHKQSGATHLSNGEELAHRVPVVKTSERVVSCSGDSTSPFTGHPIVYIQLKTRHGGPVACKYCSKRYLY
jgi:uncharacterized Zn-finger protein